MSCLWFWIFLVPACIYMDEYAYMSAKPQQRSNFFKRAHRPRSEAKNGATVRHPKASWELPGCKTNKGLKGRSPLTSLSQASDGQSMTMNFPVRRIFMLSHCSFGWTCQDASFALLKLYRLYQTNNIISVPHLRQFRSSRSSTESSGT